MSITIGMLVEEVVNTDLAVLIAMEHLEHPGMGHSVALDVDLLVAQDEAVAVEAVALIVLRTTALIDLPDTIVARLGNILAGQDHLGLATTGQRWLRTLAK